MIRFGPSGNSESFYAAGYSHTEEAASYVKEMGLDCFEYSFGRGVRMTAEKAGASLHYPALRYCTDNAAMIGAAAYFDIMSGAEPAPLTLDAKATVRLA